MTPRGSLRSFKGFTAPFGLVALVSAALAALAPTTALAQDPAAAPAAPAKSAADLRTDARATMDKGDVAAACVLFEQAYTASKSGAADAAGPKPDEILFELAACHEKQGLKDIAANEFDQV